MVGDYVKSSFICIAKNHNKSCLMKLFYQEQVQIILFNLQRQIFLPIGRHMVTVCVKKRSRDAKFMDCQSAVLTVS